MMKKFIRAEYKVVVNVTEPETSLPALGGIANNVLDVVADHYVINAVRHKKARFSFPIGVRDLIILNFPLFELSYELFFVSLQKQSSFLNPAPPSKAK